MCRFSYAEFIIHSSSFVKGPNLTLLFIPTSPVALHFVQRMGQISADGSQRPALGRHQCPLLFPLVTGYDGHRTAHEFTYSIFRGWPVEAITLFHSHPSGSIFFRSEVAREIGT